MQEIMMGMGGVQDTPEYPVGWSRRADFPYGPIFMHTSTLLGDDLYVFGGNLNGNNTNRTFKLHIPSDTWSEVVTTGTPTARSESSLVAIDGLLYMYAGNNGAGGQCWRLDPATRIWIQRAIGATSRSHRAVAYQGKMVVVGGNGPAVAQTVRIYDPASNTWSTGAPFSSTIYDHAMDLFDDEIWIYGGFISSQYSAAVWSYSLTTQTWTSRGLSPPGRLQPTFTNLNGVGYSYGGTPNTGVDRFKRLELPNTWTQLTDAPANRYFSATAAWHGKMIMVGGYRDVNGATNEVWLYNPG